MYQQSRRWAPRNVSSVYRRGVYTAEVYMEATWGVLEKDKVQALAAEKQGVGGGTDLRERQGQKHNKSQEYSSRTGTPDLILNQI